MANSSIFLGNSVVDTLYKGDKQIEAIYKGEYQIYSLGEFAGLRITKNLKFGIGGGKANLSLKSSEDWTLATDAEWLHLSSTGGTAGNYKIEVSADENGNGEDRTAEIIASSATYSAVCQVVQYYVQQVSYVYATQNPTTRNMTTAGIVIPNILFGDEFKIVAEMMWEEANGTNGEVTIGYAYKENRGSYYRFSIPVDNDDFRIFHAYRGSWFYDIGSARQYVYKSLTSSLHTFTMVNYKLDADGDYIINRATKAAMPTERYGAEFYIDCQHFKFKSVKAYNGETLVIDAFAALLNGVVGAFDKVSKTFFPLVDANEGNEQYQIEKKYDL